MQQKIIAIFLLATLPVPGFSEEMPIRVFSANVSVVTDYVLRGIS